MVVLMTVMVVVVVVVLMRLVVLLLAVVVVVVVEGLSLFFTYRADVILCGRRGFKIPKLTS